MRPGDTSLGERTPEQKRADQYRTARDHLTQAVRSLGAALLALSVEKDSGFLLSLLAGLTPAVKAVADEVQRRIDA